MNAKLKITAHCLVKNEDIWVWYALNSILPFVDQVLVFDTGSTDRTAEVISKIKSDKIIFEKKGEVSRENLYKFRQEQIDRTKTDWFLILDGDEIWPITSIDQIKTQINDNPESIAVVNRVRNSLGDVYHYQDEAAGRYKIGEIEGNLNIRFIKKIPNLKVMGTYPLEYYGDDIGPIQDQSEKLIFSDAWVLHTSFLKRSSKDAQKVSGSFGRSKYPQLGEVMRKEDLPKVLYLENPLMLKDPFEKRGLFYEVVAKTLNPVIKIKRSL